MIIAFVSNGSMVFLMIDERVALGRREVLGSGPFEIDDGVSDPEGQAVDLAGDRTFAKGSVAAFVEESGKGRNQERDQEAAQEATGWPRTDAAQCPTVLHVPCIRFSLMRRS